MLISASILDKNKYQLVKEAIQKIAPEATIYEEDNEYSHISAFARRLKYKIKDWLKIKEG